MNFTVTNLVRSNIKDMQPYSSARDEFKDFKQQMIYLDANENPFESGINRYPDTQQSELKSVLSELKNIDTNKILIGNGSDEILDLLFRAFCEPNEDNVITLPPTYGMYSVLANLNAIENKEVLLNEDFRPNVTRILFEVNKNTKIIFLCSPNNPTGNSFLEESIVTLLNNFNGLVVIDEAYIDFSSKESWLKKINEYPNLVVSQTLSKAYGMAGLRLGILYASEEIIAILNKIKPPYNINILSQQKAIEEVLKNKISTQVSIIKDNRDILLKELLQVKFVKKVYESDANFILIKVDNANLRYQQLLEKQVVVRNRTSQPLCENCLRITIGTSEENLKLINTLKQL